MKDIETVEKIQQHLEEITKLLGIEETVSNKDTPKRVAKMWCNELFENRNADIKELDAKMTVFPNEYENEMVIVRDIAFNSTCEHHWLPFSGKMTIAYIPTDKVAGLSKIPRAVRFFSRKPQLQEKLTKEVGEYLFNLLEPLALFVVAEATHDCVKCRGAESDSSTITQYSQYNKELNKLENTKRSDIVKMTHNMFYNIRKG